jgi:hypothetical protein
MSANLSPSPHAEGVEWGGSGWGICSFAPTPPTPALPTLGYAGGEGE